METHGSFKAAFSVLAKFSRWLGSRGGEVGLRARGPRNLHLPGKPVVPPNPKAAVLTRTLPSSPLQILIKETLFWGEAGSPELAPLAAARAARTARGGRNDVNQKGHFPCGDFTCF